MYCFIIWNTCIWSFQLGSIKVCKPLLSIFLCELAAVILLVTYSTDKGVFLDNTSGKSEITCSENTPKSFASSATVSSIDE